MIVPPLFLWVSIPVNYLIVWVSYALSRRSIRSNGKTKLATLLGIVFIFSCIVTMVGMGIRDRATTSFEIMLFGGKSAIFDYKYGKAVIRQGHEMYAENTPLLIHILITLAYIALLIWPTYKSSRLWNGTALIEEKIEELKNQ
jgi:hypothetical protein